MYNNSKIAKAIRLAMVFGAGAAATISTQAFSADEESAEDVERIEVTGSRIKRADMETSSPIQVTTAEDIKVAGYTRIEDMLNTLPQIETGQTAFQSNGASGEASLDLRGLGSQRTLTLINGRRMQPGSGSSGSADVNNIPTGLIKRVEVMTGGGSSVYGADAVAGVVNFVMDDDFEGFKFNATASGYQHDNSNSYVQGLMDDKGFDYPSGNTGIDGKTYNLELIVGGDLADGKGHAVAYATWQRNDELRQGARDYSSCALNAAATKCGGSANAIIPNFDLYAVNADGTTDYDRNAWVSLDPSSNFIDSPSSNRYNYAPVNHFMRPAERITFGSFADYEINDSVKPYLEVMYMNNKTRAQIAESGTFFNEEYIIDLDNSLLNDAQRGYLVDNLGIPADGQFAAYVGKRNVEGGPRVDIIEQSSYRLVLGSEGDLSDTWTYDVSFQYGYTASTDVYKNDFFAPRITTALSASGESCADTSGCIPYEVFTYQGVTPEQAGPLTGVAALTTQSKQTIFSAYATGDLDITMPSADTPVAIVVGAEYRDEQYERITDEVYSQGLLLGQGGPTKPLAGGYDVKEVYFEASIPLVEDASFAKSFVLELGGRYSDYNTSGAEPTYKVAVDWTPIDDWKIRASYNRAARAPNIGELFANQSIGLWDGQDPCAGAAPGLTASQCANTGVSASQYGNVSASPAGQYNALFGGNQNLKPEIADTYSLGFVGQLTDTLNISVDYWNISIDDVIDTVEPELSIEQCATTANAAFCDNITRSPSGNLWLGQAGFVTATNLNLASRQWEGVDISSNFDMQIAGGDLNLSFIGTYMMTKEYEPLPDTPEAVYDCAGLTSTTCYPQPSWRHVATANYTTGDFWAVTATWRYYGQVDYNDTTDTLAEGGIDAQSYIDLTGSFEITENVTAQVGVNNILDKAPPLLGNTLSDNGNTYAGYYDTLGRYIHTSITLKF
jgi:iron complex outermembrane recepter protein